MSERLSDLVKRKLLELGDNALSKLSVEAGLSPSTVNDIRRGHIASPRPGTVRRLALACGATNQEANELALIAERAKETA